MAADDTDKRESAIEKGVVGIEKEMRKQTLSGFYIVIIRVCPRSSAAGFLIWEREVAKGPTGKQPDRRFRRPY